MHIASQSKATFYVSCVYFDVVHGTFSWIIYGKAIFIKSSFSTNIAIPLQHYRNVVTIESIDIPLTKMYYSYVEFIYWKWKIMEGSLK